MNKKSEPNSSLKAQYIEAVEDKYQCGLEICEKLIGLIESNADYKYVCDRLTASQYTALPEEYPMGDRSNFSSEYALGYLRGLQIFLFPEAERERLINRKRMEVKIYE